MGMTESWKLPKFGRHAVMGNAIMFIKHSWFGTTQIFWARSLRWDLISWAC